MTENKMVNQQEAQASESAVAKAVVDSVQRRIAELEKEGGIDFPPNYSVANALRSAWLIIQETKDMNNRPAADVCSRESVANAMFNTVVQGLNPAKKQIYYIVYGGQLQAQRSYFGTMAVTKRLHGVQEIYADVVYQNDIFRCSKKRGSWVVEEHSSDPENIDMEHIKAAYCTIVRTDGSEYTEVMNWKQIQTSWSKSKTGQKVHKEFPDQMAKRTVINRACKMFVNTSDDSDLIAQAFAETGDPYVEEPAAVITPGTGNQLETVSARLLGSTKPQAVIELPQHPADKQPEPAAEVQKEPEKVNSRQMNTAGSRPQEPEQRTEPEPEQAGEPDWPEEQQISLNETVMMEAGA